MDNLNVENTSSTEDIINDGSMLVRATQEKIDALKREVFNLKLERYLHDQESKKTSRRQYYQDNENLVKSLKEYQQNNDRLLREIEYQTVALTDAMTTIENQKKSEKLLIENHTAEINSYQNAIAVLENKLKQKDNSLRSVDQKELIEKVKESSLTGSEGEGAEIPALPGKVMTSRLSTYQKKLFRVKLKRMALLSGSASTATSTTDTLNSATKLQTERKNEKLKTKLEQQNNIKNNKLLLMILKKILMHHSVKHERDFHIDIIFNKETLENIASFEVLGATTLPTDGEGTCMQFEVIRNTRF